MAESLALRLPPSSPSTPRPKAGQLARESLAEMPSGRGNESNRQIQSQRIRGQRERHRARHVLRILYQTQWPMGSVRSQNYNVLASLALPLPLPLFTRAARLMQTIAHASLRQSVTPAASHRHSASPPPAPHIPRPLERVPRSPCLSRRITASSDLAVGPETIGQQKGTCEVQVATACHRATTCVMWQSYEY